MTGNSEEGGVPKTVLSSVLNPKATLLDGFSSPLMVTLQHYMVKLEVSATECLQLCLEQRVNGFEAFGLQNSFFAKNVLQT